jgi:hypothetical protein
MSHITCGKMRSNYRYDLIKFDDILLYRVSPPRPGTNWADWSDMMGREMYLCRALDRLNFEYPPDSDS